MTKLTYIGIKQAGKAFRILHNQVLKDDLSKLQNGKYRLTIEKYRRNKSNAQLGYLFANVYPFVLQGLNDAGWEFTNISQVDALCKKMFAHTEILNRDTGEIMDIPELKRDMTTTDMMTYIDAIRNWASEYLNIVIPEPETQTELFTEK